MGEIRKCFELLSAIRQRVDLATKEYIRTTPFCVYQVGGKSVELDVRALLLIGAITESDVLLTGKTGSGKTRLANGVMNALFGPDGFYSKTTLPNMSSSDFMDIDFPAILEGKKTLREAISGIPALVRAGIVLNEVNRAPSIIQSLLIPFLDRELEVQGIPVEMGRAWAGGRYQFRILTINEGGAYQVQDLDPAIRDRMTIEIPVDAFPQARRDLIDMLTSAHVDGGQPDPEENVAGESDDYFDMVTALRKNVETLPIGPEVQFFLVYLAGLSFCVRAPRGNKESIALSPDVCSGCHHMAAFYNLCGNILAPSARILLRLQRVAKAFALFRAWQAQNENDAQVVPQDVIEAAPFVLYSKLSIHPNWVRTAGDRSRPLYGDRWSAIRDILAWLYEERFRPILDTSTEIGEFFYLYATNRAKLGRVHWERVHRYLVEKDPWAFDPAIVRKVLASFEE